MQLCMTRVHVCSPSLFASQGHIHRSVQAVVQLASGDQFTVSELAHCPFSTLVQAFQSATRQILDHKPGLLGLHLGDHGSILRNLDVHGIITRPHEAGALANWLDLAALPRHVDAVGLRNTAVSVQDLSCLI